MPPVPSRPLDIATFLDQHGWGEAVPQSFDGDFSPRRYARLTQADGRTAILMDADADQKTPEFIAIDDILRKSGIQAPEIYAADAARGLVLMQDFGSANVGALLDGGADAKSFLLQGVEILARLHSGFAPATQDAGLPHLDAAYFIPQLDLFLDFYLPLIKKSEITEEDRRDFRSAWQVALRIIENLPTSLMLRDYMPDNLMQLPDGSLGVLDFQDGGVGCIAYDLASLCEEVRRDGAFAFLPDIVAHYRAVTQSPLTQDELIRACLVLSAQRHTRILGTVTRLAFNGGQRHRLDYLPRIERHLAHVLQAPALLPVREWMERHDAL